MIGYRLNQKSRRKTRLRQSNRSIDMKERERERERERFKVNKKRIMKMGELKKDLGIWFGLLNSF